MLLLAVIRFRLVLLKYHLLDADRCDVTFANLHVRTDTTYHPPEHKPNKVHLTQFRNRSGFSLAVKRRSANQSIRFINGGGYVALPYGGDSSNDVKCLASFFLTCCVHVIALYTRLLRRFYAFCVTQLECT